MEIRTCEEYVVNELIKSQEEVELMKKHIKDMGCEIEVMKMNYNHLLNLIEERKRILRPTIEDECFRIKAIYMLSKKYYPEDYSKLIELFNIEESNDDRAEEDTKTDEKSDGE